MMGKPLIGYTIEAALLAQRIQRLVVSTDDEEIAEIARMHGADVPFLRPSALAQDETPTLPVLQHVLSALNELDGSEPEIIVLLQPTSPLRKAEDIDRAVELLEETGTDSVVSLCLAEHSPYWMMRLEGNRVQSFLENETEYTRRQDVPLIYRLNGAVYVTRRRILMEQNLILGKDTRGIVMDAESSTDIDTRLDFKIAELILKERQNASD